MDERRTTDRMGRDPEGYRWEIERLRQMTPEQRLAIVFDLIEAAKQIRAAGREAEKGHGLPRTP